MTGLLVGLGNVKEAKAANNISGEVTTSGLTSDTDYEISGDTTITIDSAFSTTGKFTFAENSKLTIKDGGTGGSFTLSGASAGFSGQNKGDLIFESGDIILTGGGSRTSAMGGTKSITISGGTITATNNGLGAVSSFIINGGTVNINAAGIQNSGLYSEGKLEINGGTVSVEQGQDRSAISAPNISITGGKVTAKGKMGIVDRSLGGAWIKISGGEVNCTGGDEDSDSAAGIFSNGPLTISGGTVTATGTGEYCYGIYTKGNMTITDATVTATGGSGADGIMVFGDTLKISGSSTVVKAVGGSGAIIVEGDGGKITIEDPLGVVKPEGGGLSENKCFIAKTSGSGDYGDIAKDVEIKKVASDTYKVTTKAENGTATADPDEAEAGKTIKLSANPSESYEFVEWTSSDVSIDNATSADKASFTMPAKNVTVTAVFKKKGDPEPSKKVVINSDEELTLNDKFGMEYSLCDEKGNNFKNVKFTKFEISGDLPDGLKIVQAQNDNGDCYQIKGTPAKAGTYKFTVTITFTSDEYPDGAELVDYITFKVFEKEEKKESEKSHDDDDKDKNHSHDDHSEVVNPDAIICYYIVNGVIDSGALFGKQEQGPVCKALFTASCPKSWTEAFSFSMSYDGVNTDTLKNGTLKLYIPGQFQKAGRKYAVMAMDKYGKVHIYQDTDLLPFVFTSPLNFEGYAFNLIYMD